MSDKVGEIIQARVRTLMEIVQGYPSVDDKITILVGNFRRVLGERERFKAVGEETLRVFDMLESQVEIGSESISQALWAARDDLRTVMENLTS